METIREKKIESRVVLIETPFLSQTGTKEVQEYLQSKYNLALLSIGTYLKVNSDFNVKIINMVNDRLTSDDLLDLLHKESPIVAGIPLYSYCLTEAYKIALRIKKELPYIHITVGGPHVSIYPRETAFLNAFDSIILGDGEVPFCKLCHQIRDNKNLDNAMLPNGVYTKTSITDKTVLEPYTIDDINQLPIPDLTLLGDYKRYKDFLSNKVMGLLCSSRGCPNICYYCRSEKSKYRRYTVDYIINVLKYYKSMGIEYFEFWDETFNSSLGRLEKVADALIKADLGMNWTIRGAVVNHISADTLEKLKESGLRLIQFGVETTSPRLLKFLNKRINRKKISEAFDICHKIGIRTVANLMINIPGQTKEEIISDFDYIKKIMPTYISVSIYNWAPGTTLYEEALRNGELSQDHWLEFALNPLTSEPVIHAVTEIDIKSVYKLRSDFVYSFYFNIKYVLFYMKIIDRSEIYKSIRISILMLKSYFLS